MPAAHPPHISQQAQTQTQLQERRDWDVNFRKPLQGHCTAVSTYCDGKPCWLQVGTGEYASNTKVWFYKSAGSKMSGGFGELAYSGNPGTIHSPEHFYMSDRHLQVQGSSLMVLDLSAYDYVVPTNVQLAQVPPEFLGLLSAVMTQTSAQAVAETMAISAFQAPHMGVLNAQVLVTDTDKKPTFTTTAACAATKPQGYAFRVETAPGKLFVRKCLCQCQCQCRRGCESNVESDSSRLRFAPMQLQSLNHHNHTHPNDPQG